MKKILSITTFLLILLMTSLQAKTLKHLTPNSNSHMDTITLGAGCFWCVEVIFDEIKGVKEVVSGYSNGSVKNPTYKQVCTGQTGCVEVCQVSFDPAIISLEKILQVFWKVHDPTTLNRQGADVGTQYRSGIYFHNDHQEKVAKSILMKLNEDQVFTSPIVTEILAIKDFSKAENYHQDYYELNGENPYCKAVITPKLEKFKQSFEEILK